MKFAKETWILAALCLLDMLSTAWLLSTHSASEANPVMGFYVDLGLPAFMAVKTLLIFAPLYVLELLRRHRPQFITGLLRAGIVGYMLVYGLGVLHANTASAEAPLSLEYNISAR